MQMKIQLGEPCASPNCEIILHGSESLGGGTVRLREKLNGSHCYRKCNLAMNGWGERNNFK